MQKVCRALYEDIYFAINRIVPCCSRTWDNLENIDKYFLNADLNLKEFDFNYYIKKRNEYTEMFINGQIPEFCKDCQINDFIYVDEKCQNKLDLNKIYVANQTKCSCRCIYCCLADNGNDEKFKEMMTEEVYDIKPILANIVEQKLISMKNLEVIFCGGECTEYPDELEFILELFKKYNCKFSVFTNAIIFNENIAKILRTGKMDICVSLDSGSQKTYEVVKRVKAWDTVTNNIKKYASIAKNNKDAGITLKYIIIPEVNDNINELKLFLKFAEENNIKEVSLSIERFWFMENSKKAIPQTIKKMIKYYLNNKIFSKRRKIEYYELPEWYVRKAINNSLFSKLKDLFLGK